MSAAKPAPSRIALGRHRENIDSRSRYRARNPQLNSIAELHSCMARSIQDVSDWCSASVVCCWLSGTGCIRSLSSRRAARMPLSPNVTTSTIAISCRIRLVSAGWSVAGLLEIVIIVLFAYQSHHIT